MAPVGRPPVLAVGHQRGEVALQRRDVELLDLFAIVEALERVGLGVMLVQDVEVQRVRPPVHHRGAGRGVRTMHHRAFAGGRHRLCVHVSLPHVPTA